jgi:2'-5' RNA ligase
MRSSLAALTPASAADSGDHGTIGGGLQRAESHAPPLVVLRSETETGHVALRLVGELDLHTVDVLEAALARTRGDPPPSVIDLSELGSST